MRNLLFILIALCVLFTYTASAASHTKGHSKHKSVAHHHNKHSPKKHHTPAHHSTGKKKKTTKKVTKKTSKKGSKKGSKKSTTKKTPTTHAHQKAYPKHKIVAYVLDWDTPKNIVWNKLDHIVYAFAEPNVKGDLKNFDGNNLKKLVNEAHKHNVGVSISVAGWSGSIHMSSLVADANRETFASKIVALVDKYNLDGVNLDWEFPNSPDSIACSERNPMDTANYLALFQALRKKLDAKYPKIHKALTVAAPVGPFNDENGRGIRRLDPAWATTVDYFYLMSYEYNGSWNSVAAPNAAIRGSSHGWGVDTTVGFWANAGIPKNKMHIGITFYGKALKTAQPITETSGMYVKLDGHIPIQGDKHDELAADPCPGAKPGYTGEFQYRSIVAQGIQQNKNGWKSYWDEQSQTPYAFHAADSKFLTFENPKSIQAKMEYAKSEGLAGCMIWSLEMDDPKHSLLNAVQSARH
ncbi:uncharacterized protein RHIMIDRAFT_205883 [Rhizopus microsporus ATCC 52813]|uniref:GH18 domain-containing protein n=1 Tax=Rhizopus microsporus ATCC 52813 TaxID=1340429 RepID=A0A2G4SMM8_RHIZD|nr:uncharacterized protein RHIMIDRAFT_205883 [Rhizopus microsporus ATCC 52813]PHZ10037.1 hypothetical protein RHIMIDRAFT_205883 [Rhizopus microsporus ATCC 52813]